MPNQGYQKALAEQSGAATEKANSLIPQKNAVPLIISNPYSNLMNPMGPAGWGRENNIACDFVTMTLLANNIIAAFTSNYGTMGITVLPSDNFRFKLDLDRKTNSINPALITRPIDFIPDEDDVYAKNGMGIVWLRQPGDLETPLYMDEHLPTSIEISQQKEEYAEYHSMLAGLIKQHQNKFGGSCHISLQPFTQAEAVMLGADPKNIPQFVICDGSGTTSDDVVVAKLAHTIQSKGYLLARNERFPTGELTSRFASPATGAHSVQLKVYEGMYLDSDTGDKTKEFAKVSKDLHSIFATMAIFAKEKIAKLQPKPSADILPLNAEKNPQPSEM